MIPQTTRTGLVDLLNPAPGTITLEAMCWQLARIRRWAGATTIPINVAQHSIFVAELVRRREPEMQAAPLYALLHDAHEYLIGDIITPTVTALAALMAPSPERFHGAVTALKLNLDRAIRNQLGVPEPDELILDAVAGADMEAAAIEWQLFLPDSCGPCPFGLPSYPRRGKQAPPPCPRRLRSDHDEELRFREALTAEFLANGLEVPR